MKAQWQLIDIDTEKTIKVGEELDLVDFMAGVFDGRAMSWEDAFMFFGDPTEPERIISATKG